MSTGILAIPILASFFVVLFLTPFWIRKAKQIGLVWDDMNKLNSKKIAGSGGIMTICGFIIGVLLYIAYVVFILGKYNFRLIEIFALLNVILILAGVGLIDDLLGWRMGGLSRRSRLILVAFAAIPLMAINAGKSIVSLPFIGMVDLGLIYPLIMIPIGIAGATYTFNMLAGFNGLEAGQGIILIGAVSIVAYIMGNSWLTIIGLCMVVALCAFLFYNFYPAMVFPGDSLTYCVGGLIAVISILGNFEKIALFFFLPYIIEVVLKSRGKLIKQSFGLPKEDGSLDLRYDKIYGLEHASIALMKKLGIKPTEKKVVFSIWGIQIIIVIIGFLIFGKGIMEYANQ
ncbi:MAG: glycosyl transferase family 4 [Nanoarchaeota archaeon]|nr:glycosyl transferase family 4 [Nanoarchaeota archaeon]